LDCLDLLATVGDASRVSAQDTNGGIADSWPEPGNLDYDGMSIGGA
jgi:hypothetical protein